jgi:threonine dehydratase
VSEYIDKYQVIEAANRIAKHVYRTPVFTSQLLNEFFECELFFKCELFQKTGSFKPRGVTNTLLQIYDNVRQYGVATHSSGNHAQALAKVATKLGLQSYIVMPENANPVKIEAVKAYGGQVIFCPPTIQDRELKLIEVLEKTNSTEIHPYNNIDIIAGQSTVAFELIQDISNLDYLIVPVGGGGLLCGAAFACYHFSEQTKVIGAEPLMANDAYISFTEKKFKPVENPQTIADGLRTSLGTLTYPIIIKYVHSIMTATEENIVQSMKYLWTRMKVIVEPSGALGLSVVSENQSVFKGKRIGIILSGGNIDIHNLPW